MKIQSPWMGRVRGSAGSMTGAKVFDKNVLRAKAFEVNNPNTQAQQTERDFFRQVQQVVASVSEEELRSLFGVKPKSMSRRNALSKQVTAAFSVDGTTKSVDFSKLQAIGNGEKVNTPIVHKTAEETYVQLGSPSLLNLKDPNAFYNLIYVMFDVTENKIRVINGGYTQGTIEIDYDFAGDDFENHEIYMYVTTTTTQEDNTEAPFGSFTIKTRATSKSTPEPSPTPTITIYAGGTEANSFAHFNSDVFDNEDGKFPAVVWQDSKLILDGPEWDTVNNWWYGYTEDDVDPALPLEIVGMQGSQEFGTFQATWVVQ